MFLTGTGFAGACTPFASAAFTVCAPVNGAVVPSWNVTVADPSFPTTTVVAFGFAAFIAASTACFSAVVNAVKFLTGVFVVGAWIPFASAAFTVCAPVNGAVVPSWNVTVADPSFPTTTVVAFGFAAFIAASTACFSAVVNAVKFLTGVFVVGAWIPLDCEALTVLFPGIVPEAPPGYDTVVVPSAPTVASAPGFAASTAAFTLVFSSAVRLVILFTGVNAGSLISGANTYFNNCPPALNVTVLFPALYLSALLLSTVLSLYPFACNCVIVFCNDLILFKFTTSFLSPGTAVFDANSFPCSSTYFT